MSASHATPQASSSAPLALDHLVINTRMDIARAARLCTALGFTATPLSRHSLGSVNQLIVFPQGYLELIGLPDDGGPVRQEILDSPIGIDGLVFQVDDADALAPGLGELGRALQPVGQFSRPVVMPDATLDASFRTARFTPGRFPAGRVYYCQHLTPELIWHPPWQRHANGATALSAIAVVSPDPQATARAYAQAARTPDVRQVDDDSWHVHCTEFLIRVSTPAGHARRYGALAKVRDGATDFFGAIEIEVGDLEGLERRLAPLGSEVQWARTPEFLAVKLMAYEAVLVFATARSTQTVRAV